MLNLCPTEEFNMFLNFFVNISVNIINSKLISYKFDTELAHYPEVIEVI